MRSGGRGLALLGIGDNFGRLPESAHGVDVQPLDDGGLRGILGWDDEAEAASIARGEGDGKDTGDGADGAIQGEFAGSDELVHVGADDLLSGGEDGEGHRQIKGGAFFPKVRRREVDRHALGGKSKVGVANSGSDALARLLHGRVGQADDSNLGLARADIGLDLNPVGIYP